MSGSASEFASTDEASEPLDTSISRPDTFAAAAKQSGSSIREKIASHFEPGDTRATTRRLSDMPTSVKDQFQDAFYEEEDEQKEEPNSVLASAHQLVAKALGGGSRGAN